MRHQGRRDQPASRHAHQHRIRINRPMPLRDLVRDRGGEGFDIRPAEFEHVRAFGSLSDTIRQNLEHDKVLSDLRVLASTPLVSRQSSRMRMPPYLCR